MNKQEIIVGEKHRTVKDTVLEDFINNLNETKLKGINYFPSGLLKYYLFNEKGYPSYAGRIIADYCKDNDIQIKKAKDLNIDEWEGEKLRKSMPIYIW